ncbi:MAG: hypothetical protein ACFUZC_11215 [Chthoniobacteraceae bacterium]
MNKVIPCIVLACTSLLCAEAQQAPEPAAPYVKNAPPVSVWKVIFSKRKAVSAEAAAQYPGSMDLKEMDVTKAKTTRHEVMIYNAGKIFERWFVADRVIYTNEGNPTIFVFDTRDENSKLMFPNYMASDFPELLWISRACYAGLQKVSTEVCYYYSEPAGTRQAWIAQATGLPVAYTDGVTIQSYTFMETDNHQLELPAPFQKALNDFTNARDLSRHEAKYN